MPISPNYLDKFEVRNVTNSPVTLGDLVNVNVSPNRTLDLLKQSRVTKDKINRS